jgi:hypothetical protein
MKCIYILLILSIGLQNFRADDEVTEASSDMTESEMIADQVTYKYCRISEASEVISNEL